MEKTEPDDRGASEKVSAGEQEFNEAFDKAEGKVPDEKPAGEPPVETEKETEKETDKGKEPPQKEEPPAKEPPAKTEPDEEEKYEQRYKTLQGIHRHDKDTWEQEKSKLISELEEAKKVAPKKDDPTKEKAVQDFVDSLTDEQKKQLEEYEQDFDVVSKMEGLKRSVELAKLRKEFQAWKDEFVGRFEEHGKKLAPIAEFAEKSEAQAHFNMIMNGYTREDGTEVPGHPDFRKYRDDGSLLKWIESKPKYLQAGMKEVYEKGLATDVIDLYGDFKRELNINQESPEDKVVNIDKAKKKQALAAVNTRRGAVNADFRPADDYDGAFDEALHKGG